MIRRFRRWKVLGREVSEASGKIKKGGMLRCSR